MPEQQWVTVGNAQTDLVAQIMRTRLEAEGIEAVLRGNQAAVTAGVVNELNTSWANPLGGVEVRVRESDEWRARRILEAVRDDKPPRREFPFWMQGGAALMVASFAFSLAYALFQSYAVGAGIAVLAFVGIFVVGHRGEGSMR